MDWPPLDRTLDPAAFYSLYRGALAAESVERRLGRCYAVLLSGRLGLRPGEILHCHEGWVDWGRGELRVPALDPCACGECWAAARARRADGDERPIDELVRAEQWSPTAEADARTVAFGWSERLTALLATFFDYVEYLDADRSELRVLVRETAEAAEGVDPEGLTPSVLRATGGRFFAEAGFDATTVRGMLGLADREAAEAFVGYAGQRTSAVAYRAFDRGAVGPDVPPGDPARKFPVVCDPAPFNREPFTAADYGPQARFERDDDAAGTAIRNPRPAAVPDGFDYDPEDARLPEQVDAEGGQVSRSPGADAPDVAAMREWIQRRDASLRPESTAGDRDSTAAPGMDTGDLPTDADRVVGDGPPPEPATPSTPRRGAERGTNGSRTPAGSDAASTSDPETVAAAVTSPVVASVGTQFAAPAVAGGRPVGGQVALGQGELLLVSPPTDGDLTADGVEFSVVALSSVVDVVPDADESGTPFDSPLGIVHETGDERAVARIELGGQRKRDFWTALFRNALHVSQMQVTHPARVGGRVTDERATPGMLYLDRDSVRFTPRGSDATLLSIDLADVLHVERTQQSVDGASQPALEIQQFIGGEAVTSVVGCPSTRTLSLFERYVRRDYRQRLAAARSLSIPDPEKEVLVALYSIGDSVDVSNVVNRGREELSDIVASLESKGLVTETEAAETALTARGRLVVSDRLEAVND